MARRRHSGGRKSLGPRDLMGTRLPVEEADHLRDLAEERGLSNSDFLAALIRIGLRHLDEAPAPLPKTNEQELPLGKAS